MRFSEEQAKFIQDNRQWPRQYRVEHAWHMLTAKDITKAEQKFWRTILEMNTVK